jgi:hypothetical protein
MKWNGHPNLRFKPHSPNKGRGRIQRQVERAFRAAGDEPISASVIYDWTHGRRRGARRTLPWGVYWSVRRILREVAVRVGRAPTIGRPWLWRLRERDTDAT